MTATHEENTGRLTIAKEKRRRLRITIDGSVKALIYHFEPMDHDCVYTDKIETDRIRTYVEDITKKHNELERVIQEIKRLERELGEEESIV